MPVKKKAVAKEPSQRVVGRAQNAPQLTVFGDAEENLTSNGKHYEEPLRKNPETEKEREKRLAKREALTLRAFQIAYDNNHPRKS